MSDINELLAQDPAVQAMLRKTTSPAPQQTQGNRGNGMGTTPTRTELSTFISSRIRATRNAERLYQALPEMETIVTIATSSLLSTKDLINLSLIYENTAEDIPLDLRAKLIEQTKDYNDNERKLPSKLYTWVYNANRSQGATPVVLVSDAGFDEMFQLQDVKTTVAGESARRRGDAKGYFTSQKGFLQKIESDPNKQLVGLESILNTAKPTGPQEININFGNLMADKHNSISLTLTDNQNVFRSGEFIQRVASENAKASLYGKPQAAYEQTQLKSATDQFQTEPGDISVRLEDKLNLGDLNEAYRDTPASMQYIEVPKIKLSDDNHLEFIERPIPAQCLAPVCLAGDVQNPLGWLAVLDDKGNFINPNSTLYGDVSFLNYLNNEGNNDSIINRSALGLGEGRISPDIAGRIETRYGEITEGAITDQLSQALGGVELDLGVTSDFTRVVLTRHFAKRHTQVAYIPAENLAYFATDFNEDGIGISIAERSFVVSTIRMALLFAGMNTAILNSARNMQFDIELSPDARNGQEVVDRIKSEIMGAYARQQPMWGDADDAWAQTSNAGIAFNVTGNDYYPSHRVSVSDTTPDYKAPDKEFDESLLRRTCHIAHVDPDLVLTPENLEFASQIYSKSLLVTQQIVKQQEVLSKPITRYVTAGLQASPVLRGRLIETIAVYVKETDPSINSEELMDTINQYMRQFINGMIVRLPPPDTSAANSQMDLFDKRVTFFNELADQIVTPDLTEMMEKEGIEISADNMKTMITSFYTRQWLRKQGMESDLFDMIYDEDKRQETVKMISDDVAGAGKTLMQLAKRVSGKVETLGKTLGDPESAGEFGGGGSTDGNLDDEFDDENLDDDEFSEEGADTQTDDAAEQTDDAASDGTEEAEVGLESTRRRHKRKASMTARNQRRIERARYLAKIKFLAKSKAKK